MDYRTDYRRRFTWPMIKDATLKEIAAPKTTVLRKVSNVIRRHRWMSAYC